MIDKSIRQHYENGEKVKKLGYDVGQKLISPLKEKYMPEGKLDIGEVAKTALTRKLTGAATKKLAGTGVLSSLGPIGMLIAYMLAKKGMKYAKGKMPDIQTSLQAFQTGFGSPQEQRELRVLEKRRADMLRRKADPNKDYSERNLDIVTRAIAEAKGLDINNPNEMRNIDKPITQIQIEKRITEPQIIPETPDIISPHLDDIITRPTVEDTAAMEDIITPTVIPKTPPIISPHLGGDEIMPAPTTVTRDVGLGDAGIAERIAAENRAAAQQAAAVKAESDRQQREADAAAAAAARAAVARAYTPPVRHHTGGNGGGGGMGRGQDPGGGAAGSPFLKGGRVDKALSGRSRYL